MSEPQEAAYRVSDDVRVLGLYPRAASTSDQEMTACSTQEAAAVLGAYDFSKASDVIDVSRGQGTLLDAIPSAYALTSL